MSCIRSCYDKDSSNFGHDDCPTCIHKDSPPQRQPLKDEEYSALAETYTVDYGLLDCVDNHLYKPLQGIKE